MFLKKIEISGFKSFAQKTTLDFSGGKKGKLSGGSNITAIVGPNGSGKSNVADALRWVMGEQSMKAIRGKKSKDVIFAGSKKKARLSAAQVSIFLDNTNQKIPVDFNEVVVTRKIYRSGESEYLVNGSKVRLTDVVDFLARAGIGQRSYCIINQGMADQILQASPLERRAIIEEAAGVKEFQIKKERSQRKLNRALANLEKVKALLLEIEPHLRTLKRQNNRAQKGELYRVELKEKQQIFFGYLWQTLKQEQALKLKKEKEIRQQLTALQKVNQEISERLRQESQGKFHLQNKISDQEAQQRKLNNDLSSIERSLVLEEGKLELEKERAKRIETVILVPVNMEMIKDSLMDIKIRQEELVRRISELDPGDSVQEIKEYARAITQEVYELYGAIIKGKKEKKKPDQEIKKQKELVQKKIVAIENKITQLKKQKSEFIRRLKEGEKAIQDLVKEDREERKKAIELEDKLRKDRFEMDKVRDLLNEVQIELAKMEAKEEELGNRIQTELKTYPSRLSYIEGKTPNLNELQIRISRLQAQLQQIGGIDETVIQEYKETSERYDFLKREVDDLNETIQKLKRVVSELEMQIKERFQETFKYINKEFERYFKIIFGGGRAGLEKKEIKSVTRNLEPDSDENMEEITSSGKDALTGEADENLQEEESQVGIEVIAVPPGKKITNLGMLSGGERALTSIALLFAVIAHNPPPFALLDEVEAALDEANSKRFSRILRELSKKTQFILVTHNRQTMQEASFLYGVTMGDDGVSRLLSIKLDQVEKKGLIEK
ncbi:MAG TPA: AAA family ATPase [Candidatus Moranbacteria bacterium]|nr:AAA family ATPase [Candidatus Moranbacteria bacterium]